LGKRSKRLLIGTGILALVLVVAYAERRSIVLAGMAWKNEHDHPVAPNHPIAWAEGPAAPESGGAARPPNIVVILADDLGYNDVSFYGGGVIPTPAIDSLGKDGVAFPVAYSAAPVCAPSRAAVLTSRYATRSGYEFTPTPKQMPRIFELFGDADQRPLKPILDKTIADHVPEIDEECLPGSEVTIAEVLKARGYHTAHIGKWHLGRKPGSSPNDQGFDESLLLEGSLYSPSGSPEKYNARHPRDPLDVTLWRLGQHAVSYNGGPRFAPRGYLTDYFTDEAVRVIEANKNRPFLLYLAHWAVHVPMQASAEDYDALPGIADHGLRVHAAMVRSLDRSVRRVLDALARNGLADNTLVVFTSDNGGPDYVGLRDLNKPYRGWKLTMFEGGTHVPHFMRWPGQIPAGSRFAEPVSHLDIMPTAVAAAGAAMPSDRVIDGTDLMPYLQQRKAGRPHDVLYWREGSYQAVRAGDWKLQVSRHPSVRWLYDLRADPTERRNLAASSPQKQEELERLLDAWNRQQAAPLWPSFAELPIYIDRTIDDPVSDGDEYVYWPN
jgi:uncharacterized sulfatase